MIKYLALVVGRAGAKHAQMKTWIAEGSFLKHCCPEGRATKSWDARVP